MPTLRNSHTTYQQPNLHNALAHMDTGGQVNFHELAVGDGRKSDAVDVTAQILKVLGH